MNIELMCCALRFPAGTFDIQRLDPVAAYLKQRALCSVLTSLSFEDYDFEIITVVSSSASSRVVHQTQTKY